MPQTGCFPFVVFPSGEKKRLDRFFCYNLSEGKIVAKRRKEMKKGFTLIELLVVVLIIGILSSVALPQYTKAVRKARIVEARTILSSLIKAEDLYILENGNTYWNSWEDLSIEVPTETKNWTFHQEECIPGSNGKVGCGVYAEPKWESGYQIECWSPNYDGGSDDFSGSCFCSTLLDSEEGVKICKSLGTYEEDYDRYRLN